MVAVLTLFFEVLLALLVLGVSGAGMLLLWAQKPRRLLAWHNRRRHRDLNRKYNATTDSARRNQIAQLMLVRDRDKLHETGLAYTGRYPDIYDYHIPPGKLGLLVSRRRRADRMADAPSARA